ncbi:MAG: hypothetical protein HRT89_18575 [Lentisphaeria bacterium]|nr:hypothetical protein [Lentisphaeria bacterium]NQZ70063.1 hypothetical protein [Lentisphaeria bacterium]
MSEEKKKKKLNREEIAEIEVGNTEISQSQKLYTIISFLLLIIIVPLIQLGSEMKNKETIESLSLRHDIKKSISMIKEKAPDDCIVDKTFEANRVMLKGIGAYEGRLEDASFLSEMIGPVQELMTGVFNVGNEKAFTGVDKWLYYKPGVQYLTGRGFLEHKQLRKSWRGSDSQPDPVFAILDFQRQLAKRNIQLLIMPAPVKAMIHPEKYTSRYDGKSVLQNPSYTQFLAELKDPALFLDKRIADYRELIRNPDFTSYKAVLERLVKERELLKKQAIIIYDPSELMLKLKEQGPVFLETDTHWTATAMAAVAEDLTKFLIDKGLVKTGYNTYKKTAMPVSNLGDVAGMLKLPEAKGYYKKQSQEIQQITFADKLWRPDKESPVLFLGDSFSNIYSLGAMNWGESAGFAEHLSAGLKQSIDAITQNDAGSNATRKILSRELNKGRDRLAGKTIVIWEFAARELAVGDWQILDMTLGELKESEFVTLEDEQTIEVEGIIEAMTFPPKPGSVTYKDHVVQLHLIDLKSTNKAANGQEVLINMQSMRNSKWTSVARYRVGQKVKLKLYAWEGDKENKYGKFKTALLQTEAGDEDPLWGEEINKELE